MKNDSYLRRRTEKIKRMNNSLYKTMLFVITLTVFFIILAGILFIFALGIGGFVVFEELQIGYFLFGNYYNPTQAMFAAGFMIINTIWVSFLALLLAVPISIFTAIFATRILPKSVQSTFIVLIAILAAVPSVIYGAFGLYVIDRIVLFFFDSAITGSVLTIVLMLAMMVTPTITILSISAIRNVDTKLEESSLTLGATRTQTSLFVTLRAAKKGIIIAIFLGLGRALGEATAVSMVASQTSYGPTFGLLGSIRLLTATMLQGFQETAPGTVERANMYAMASLLMISLGIIFYLLFYAEKHLSDEYKFEKYEKLITGQKKVRVKVDDTGTTDSLNYHEQKIYAKMEMDKYFSSLREENEEKWIHKYGMIKSSESTTITQSKQNQLRFKKRTSRRKNLIIGFFALFGVLFLLSIVIFLLNGGLSVLNWEYLTTKGEYALVEVENTTVTIYGLATPIFGTIFMVVLGLTIAIPIGVSIGILTSVYLTDKSLFSRMVNYFIQILTGIPSLIYGIIGVILFLPLASAMNFTSLAGAMVMSIIVLPTIIKTTHQSIRDIPEMQQQGSLSLGATKFTTTSRILFKTASPAIISSAVVAAGIIMADSAVFIVLFGTVSQNSIDGWIQNGGTTLATEMYKLTKLEVIPWDYVKAIGIVLIVLIISMSYLANTLREKRTAEALTFGSGFTLFLIGILIPSRWMFLLGFGLMVFAMFILGFIFLGNEKWNWKDKLLLLYYKIRY